MLAAQRTLVRCKHRVPAIQNMRMPPYSVILLNDSETHNSHVEVTLTKVIPDMSREEAKEKRIEAHNMGRSKLRTCHQELAETYCTGLRTHGLSSIIEPEA